MNILYIAVEAIYPTDAGSRIRAYQLIKSLSTEHSVSLAYLSAETMPMEPQAPYRCAEHITLATPLSELSGMLKAKYLVQAMVRRSFPMTEYFSDSSANDQIGKLVEKQATDIVIIQSSYLLPLASQLKKRFPHLKIILDAHNVESQLQSRIAQNSKSMVMKQVKRLMAANLQRIEQKASYVSAIAAVSGLDKAWWQKYYPQMNVALIANGVDVDFFKQTKPLPQEPVIAFCGSMSYQPNNEGVLWFYENVWPKVIEQLSRTRWLIIGKSPTQEVSQLAGPKIVVTGRVDDVRLWLEQSRLSVVPLLAGGGTRLKILEALSMERVVVSTQLGAEGIVAAPGIILVNKPEEMAKTIVSLLGSKDLVSMGKANRQLAVSTYSWQAIGELMKKLVAEVGNKS